MVPSLSGRGLGEWLFKPPPPPYCFSPSGPLHATACHLAVGPDKMHGSLSQETGMAGSLSSLLAVFSEGQTCGCFFFFLLFIKCGRIIFSCPCQFPQATPVFPSLFTASPSTRSCRVPSLNDAARAFLEHKVYHGSWTVRAPMCPAHVHALRFLNTRSVVPRLLLRSPASAWCKRRGGRVTLQPCSRGTGKVPLGKASRLLPRSQERRGFCESGHVSETWRCYCGDSRESHGTR